MTKYEATYVKSFVDIYSPLEDAITAKSELANLINDKCIYSAYWPKTDYDWIPQAEKDLIKATKIAEERLRNLKRAGGILNCID